VWFFFHSGFSFFSGGYVGVDIFFVISGFLITTIIYREIEENSFSIARFYERRIRRIFPALFSVILFSLLFGVIFYAPEDFEKLARSVRYTVIFFSNYLFAKKTGYFDTGAEFEPLLHTWSLAVEEQYYIVFPVILMIMAKVGGGKACFMFGCSLYTVIYSKYY
jgi:peptidoglycan/LPS O-acetylase OafA/YrhL